MIQASQQNGMRKLKNLNTHTNTAAQPKTMNWQRGKRIYYEILMKKHFFFSAHIESKNFLIAAKFSCTFVRRSDFSVPSTSSQTNCNCWPEKIETPGKNFLNAPCFLFLSATFHCLHTSMCISPSLVLAWSMILLSDYYLLCFLGRKNSEPGRERSNERSYLRASSEKQNIKSWRRFSFSLSREAKYCENTSFTFPINVKIKKKKREKNID